MKSNKSGPKVVINCAECGNTVDEPINKQESDPCPHCGSNRRIMDIDHGEEIVELNIKVQSISKIKDPKQTGRRKIRQERLFGDNLHKESGKWDKKERIIDRENDRYIEKIIDPETGEVIRHCDEPLSEHQGHGYAKKKNNKANTTMEPHITKHLDLSFLESHEGGSLHEQIHWLKNLTNPRVAVYGSHSPGLSNSHISPRDLM